jgi:hypothetical protein
VRHDAQLGLNVLAGDGCQPEPLEVFEREGSERALDERRVDADAEQEELRQDRQRVLVVLETEEVDGKLTGACEQLVVGVQQRLDPARRVAAVVEKGAEALDQQEVPCVGACGDDRRARPTCSA